MKDGHQGIDRHKCILHLDHLLTKTLSNGGSTEHGQVEWMSHAIIADLEEFVVDPFGPVVPESVAKENYSQKGHDMVNDHLNNCVTYQECLKMIVLHIYTNTPLEHVKVLGYHGTGMVIAATAVYRPG
jgi:hypothetical protein